jgi:hypothetical protein
MFRDWYVTHSPLVMRWMSTDGWGGCVCRPGECFFLPPHWCRDKLVDVMFGPSTEWTKWGLIFQGLHCAKTFYQFTSDPLNELLSDPVPIDVVSGLVSLSWYDEDDLLQLVRFVVDNGADVDARRPDGLTPLFAAVHHAALQVAAELVKLGANVNAVDQRARSVLFAIGRQHGEITEDKECMRALVRMNLSTDALAMYANTPCELDYPNVRRAAQRKQFASTLIPRATRAREAANLVLFFWRHSTLSNLPLHVIKKVVDMVLYSQTQSDWDW